MPPFCFFPGSREAVASTRSQGGSGSVHFPRMPTQAWDMAPGDDHCHKLDQVGFLRGGGRALFPGEIELVGVGGRG